MEEPLDESEKGEWKIWLKTQHSKNYNHGIWSLTSWQIDGKTVELVEFFWALKSLQMVIAAMKLKDVCSLEEKLWPT